MNHTQKKYAVNRIVDIFKVKLKDVIKQYDVELKAYELKTHLTIEAKFDAILAGEAFFRPSKTSKVVGEGTIDYSVSITRLAAGTIKPARVTLNCTKLYVQGSNTENFYTYSKKAHLATEKANKFIQAATDEIFLGSEEDALAAIAKFTNLEL